MTYEEVARALLSKEYRYAKSMPKNPHWYSLREEWADEKQFEDVVEYIRQNGYREQFFRMAFTMFNLNGYKYWTYGDPVKETIVLNRALVSYPNAYDAIAETYSTMFQDEASIQEERELFQNLEVTGKILDIGCGTGMLLNHVNVSPENYTGIDVSKGMIDVFKRNHPDYANRVIVCDADDFFGEGYDTITLLFGTPDYIRPRTRARIKNMLAPGGNAYFMFYKKGYNPVTHIKTGIHPYMFANEDKGAIFRNYEIVSFTK